MHKIHLESNAWNIENHIPLLSLPLPSPMTHTKIWACIAYTYILYVVKASCVHEHDLSIILLLLAITTPNSFFLDGWYSQGKCLIPSRKVFHDGNHQGYADRESPSPLMKNRHRMIPNGSSRQWRVSAPIFSFSTWKSSLLAPAVKNKMQPVILWGQR